MTFDVLPGKTFPLLTDSISPAMVNAANDDGKSEPGLAEMAGWNPDEPAPPPRLDHVIQACVISAAILGMFFVWVAG
jgi:hypothetical protein